MITNVSIAFTLEDDSRTVRKRLEMDPIMSQVGYFVVLFRGFMYLYSTTVDL